MHGIRWALALCAIPAALAQAPNKLTPEEKKDGFVLLFNGKDLTGWDGDPRIWSVRDGAITGSTDKSKLEHNSFLIYKDEFADFTLRFDIKLRNHNSGMQFRSKRLPDWVVTGYQADASDVGDNSAWGNFYEEKGRGRNLMKSKDEGWLKAKSVLHKGDWNQYEVIARGNRVILRLNGVETINQEVDKTDPGVLAIQCHMGEPMEVQVRSIRLKK
jgi:3-keto-disaccharide hydrolase